MLQKIVNGIAIASGVVSLTVVGTIGFVYINKDNIINNVKQKVVESVLPSVPLPTLPNATGGAQSLPSLGESAIPKF